MKISDNIFLNFRFVFMKRSSSELSNSVSDGLSSESNKSHSEEPSAKLRGIDFSSSSQNPDPPPLRVVGPPDLSPADHFNRLPLDIRIRIFKLLSFHENLCGERVCRSWTLVIGKFAFEEIRYIWADYALKLGVACDKKEWQLEVQLAAVLSRVGAYLRAFSVEQLPGLPLLPFRITPGVSGVIETHCADHLTLLDLTGCVVCVPGLPILAKLEILVLDQIIPRKGDFAPGRSTEAACFEYLSDQLTSYLGSLPNLAVFSLENSPERNIVVRSVETLAKLRVLRVKITKASEYGTVSYTEHIEPFVTSLASKSGQIQKLSLSIPFAHGEFAAKIANLEALTLLDISGGQGPLSLDQQGLALICEKCTKLDQLCIDFSQQRSLITSVAPIGGLKSLKTLELWSFGARAGLGAVLSQCIKLEALKLGMVYRPGLTDLFLKVNRGLKVAHLEMQISESAGFFGKILASFPGLEILTWENSYSSPPQDLPALFGLQSLHHLTIFRGITESFLRSFADHRKAKAVGGPKRLDICCGPKPAYQNPANPNLYERRQYPEGNMFFHGSSQNVVFPQFWPWKRLLELQQDKK